MRSWRAAVLTIFTIAVATSATVAPAAAGGPTSVLLVAPGTGETASLYASDDDYQALAGLVGAFGATAGEAVEGASPSPSGRTVTVTWLIHDVQVWRVDRVHLDAEGGPLVATQQALDASSVGQAPVVWIRPAAGKKLAELLDRLGLAGGGQAPGGGPVPGPQPGGERLETEQTDAARPPVPAADDTGAPPAVWVLLGSLLGVALALAAPRIVAARRRTGGDVDRAPDIDWAVTDELSSTAPPRR